MAVSPDGLILAVGSPTNPIHLIRLADGKELRQIDKLEGRVHTLTFSPDGTRLYSGGRTAQLERGTSRQAGHSEARSSTEAGLRRLPSALTVAGRLRRTGQPDPSLGHEQLA